MVGAVSTAFRTRRAAWSQICHPMLPPRSTFDRLAHLESELDNVTDYASWLEVAAELDQLTGAVDQTVIFKLCVLQPELKHLNLTGCWGLTDAAIEHGD